jgi:hypothetical protein
MKKLHYFYPSVQNSGAKPFVNLNGFLTKVKFADAIVASFMKSVLSGINKVDKPLLYLDLTEKELTERFKERFEKCLRNDYIGKNGMSIADRDASGIIQRATEYVMNKHDGYNRRLDYLDDSQFSNPNPATYRWKDRDGRLVKPEVKLTDLSTFLEEVLSRCAYLDTEEKRHAKYFGSGECPISKMFD